MRGKECEFGCGDSVGVIFVISVENALGFKAGYPLGEDSVKSQAEK